MNKLRIKSVGILSIAKIYGAMGFIIGLLIGLMYGLMIIAMSLIGATAGRGSEALAMGGGGIVVGIIAIIAIPIMYGFFGFISGLIGGLIYNIFAGIVGGIEIEVENIH